MRRGAMLIAIAGVLAGSLAASASAGAKAKPHFRKACTLLTHGDIVHVMARAPSKIEEYDAQGVIGCKWTTADHVPVNESDSEQPEVVTVGVDWWSSLKQAKLYMGDGSQGNQCNGLLNRIGDQSYECTGNITFRLGHRTVDVVTFRNGDTESQKLVRTVKAALRVERRLARYSAAK